MKKLFEQTSVRLDIGCCFGSSKDCVCFPFPRKLLLNPNQDLGWSKGSSSTKHIGLITNVSSQDGNSTWISQVWMGLDIYNQISKPLW